MSDSWRPRRSSTDRTARAVQSMAPGSMEGRVASAQPVPNRKRDDEAVWLTVPVTFSFDGPPEAGNPSPAYINTDAGAEPGTIIVNTTATTTTSTTVQVLLNGSAIATLVLPSGAAQDVEGLASDVVLEYGDRLQAVVTTVGTGLSDIVIQVLLAVDE